MAKDLSESTQQQLKLRVEGLSCASCVRRAETAIAGVEGVSEASVNLATGVASVKLDAPVSLEAIAEATAAAGYPLGEEEVTVEVEGATCASCVKRIETALRSVPGVTSAAMNLATGRATLRRVIGTADADALARAVSDAGYTLVRRAPDRTETPADRRRAEIAGLQRDFLIALVLALPVIAVEMGGHVVPAIHTWVNDTIGLQASWLGQFVLTTLILAFPGRRFLTKGLPALRRRAPDMNSLVALGAGAAWVYSTVATFAPALLPAASRAVYFEAAAVIVTLILLGRLLEARAKGRTGEAIEKLIALAPDTAHVERDGKLVLVPVADIVVGDRLQLRPGERVAVDGEVVEGSTYVDESMLTGEPMPVAKAAGDPVVAGTVNGTGSIFYRATAVGADTVLSRIVAMVEDAQGAKLPVQALVDRITAWFVPVVMTVAVITVLVWLLFGPEPVLSHALVAGVAVLIIACPCAMGLATPTSIMVGTGRAAELGVLFRKGDALQTLSEIDTVVFDKTGTLTEGRPELTDLVTSDPWTRGDVLALVAGLEARSEHPIAGAILRAAETEGITPGEVEDFASITGGGVGGRVDGRDVLVGSARLMAERGIALARQSGAEAAHPGQSVLYAAVDGELAAEIAVSDPIKPSSADAVAALHRQGLQLVMLTGDSKSVAEHIGRQLGLDEVRAELLPGMKVAAVRALRAEGRRLAFVGDGINDAPALAEADVGLAMGTGTDIAIETADAVVMNGDLSGVVKGVALSRATMRNIRQNLFWAFGYNVLLIPVAAGVLFPLTGLMLSPALAAGAMALSSVFVVTNALRLRTAARN